MNEIYIAVMFPFVLICDTRNDGIEFKYFAYVANSLIHIDSHGANGVNKRRTKRARIVALACSFCLNCYISHSGIGDDFVVEFCAILFIYR